MLLVFLSGCAFRPMTSGYAGPEKRAPWVENYYPKDSPVTSKTEILLEERQDYSVRELTLYTAIGEGKVEFYSKNKPTDELVIVFPILGGKYWFERYFARYLVERGVDAAIILRNPEFKKPENIDRIEEVLRQGVQRDRLILDYFENNFGKRQFGSFGISRGGVNAAITAGVDERLRSNVFVMGGEDIVEIFRTTNQRGVGKYVKKVLDAKGYSRDDLFRFLTSTIKTDPKNLAQHIDATHALMFITIFDKTVPARFQHQMRRRIGGPATYYLATDHYASLLLTQFVPLLPPIRGAGILPFDFIETESLAFYRREFKLSSWTALELPYKILTLPSRVFFWIYDSI